ncbi:hypothetical protein SNEBB_004778, partial [Seison nebaliae]
MPRHGKYDMASLVKNQFIYDMSTTLDGTPLWTFTKEELMELGKKLKLTMKETCPKRDMQQLILKNLNDITVVPSFISHPRKMMEDEGKRIREDLLAKQADFEANVKKRIDMSMRINDEKLNKLSMKDVNDEKLNKLSMTDMNEEKGDECAKYVIQANLTFENYHHTKSFISWNKEFKRHLMLNSVPKTKWKNILKLHLPNNLKAFLDFADRKNDLSYPDCVKALLIKIEPTSLTDK